MKDKIKITKEIKEYEGNVIEKAVTPIGNSGHILVGKEFIGQILPVITPTEPQFKWILPERALDITIRECNKMLKDDKSKMAFHKKSAVDRLRSKFSRNDLHQIVILLEKTKSNQNLIDEIKAIYSL